MQGFVICGVKKRGFIDEKVPKSCVKSLDE